MPTPKQLLGDARLGGDGALERFVRVRRAEGKAWRLIARDLYEETGLDITYETLRSWYPDEVPAGEAVAS